MLGKFLNPAILQLLLVCSVGVVHAEGKSELKQPPGIGDKAPEFALNDLDGKSVSLADQLKHGPTVVVVLRGYPGYQCPLCTKQFGELMGKAKNVCGGQGDRRVRLSWIGLRPRQARQRIRRRQDISRRIIGS